MSDAILVPELLRREKHSFLQYVSEAFPWAYGTSETVRAKILGMAEAEADAQARLARLLQRRRLPVPEIEAFPSAFTHYNYLTISSLRPKLLSEMKHNLAELERDLPAVADAEDRALLESYRELKRKHIQELEAL
jgi:hypothetical protein